MFPAVGIGNPVNGSLSLYPNPATDVVNIVSGYKIREVEIINYIGQMIFKIENVNLKNLKVDISAFRAGFYFVKVTTVGGTRITKITVMR
jgi:pyrimidine operon attenuation protein/uracil phosphoribosyltransferase